MRSTLLLLAVVALLLRVAGLHWGLPEATRYYPYHPDEPVLIVAILQIDFGALQLSPRFFNYGSLYLYMCRLAIDAAAALGQLNPYPPVRDLNYMATWWRDFAAIHLVGRWIGVVMGVLTVVVTGAVAGRAFGLTVGALAAAALALAPLHVEHSHFMAVDVPATFWVALCLWCALRALETPRRGWFAAAGIAAGLAAGTKYNAGLVLLSVLAAVALAARRAAGRERFSVVGEGVTYSILGAAVAFLFATPGIVIDSKTFWANFNFERAHMAQGHGEVFIGTSPGWWFHITSSLASGLGWPLLALVLAGVVWAVRRREPADWILLAFAVPYYLLIGAFQVKFARYTLPLFPPLCVWAARAVGEWSGWRGAAPFPRTAMAVRGAAGLVAAYTLLFALALDGVMLRPDNRTVAADWIASHANRDTTVALASTPWFYTPPLSPSLGMTHPLLAFKVQPRPPNGYPLLTPAGSVLSPEEIADRRPRYVEISEFEDEDALRAARATGQRHPMVALHEALDRDYQVIAGFDSRPALGPLRWFARSPPPNDMLYVMPRVRIYERRGSR